MIARELNKKSPDESVKLGRNNVVLLSGKTMEVKIE